MQQISQSEVATSSIGHRDFKFPFAAETQNYVCKGAKRLRMRQDFNETLLNDDDLLQKQALLQHPSYSNMIYQ